MVSAFRGLFLLGMSIIEPRIMSSAFLYNSSAWPSALRMIIHLLSGCFVGVLSSSSSRRSEYN